MFTSITQWRIQTLNIRIHIHPTHSPIYSNSTTLPTTVCQKLEEPHQTSLRLQTKVTTYQNTPLETFNTSSMVKTKSKYNF